MDNSAVKIITNVEKQDSGQQPKGILMVTLNVGKLNVRGEATYM